MSTRSKKKATAPAPTQSPSPPASPPPCQEQQPVVGDGLDSNLPSTPPSELPTGVSTTSTANTLPQSDLCDREDSPESLLEVIQPSTVGVVEGDVYVRITSIAISFSDSLLLVSGTTGDLGSPFELAADVSSSAARYGCA